MSQTSWGSAAWPFPLQCIAPTAGNIGSEGKFVTRNATTGVLTVASVTDQPATNALVCAGVLSRGAQAGEHCEVTHEGPVWVIIGTGGLDPGDDVFPEYSATAADAGRGIKRTTAQLAEGAIIQGRCIIGGAAGARALVWLAPRRYRLPA
jgi:hypothetical protein